MFSSRDAIIKMIKQKVKEGRDWNKIILMLIVFITGLSVLGLGFDYPMEWRITWFYIIAVGWFLYIRK